MRKIILTTLTMLLGFTGYSQITTIYRNGKTSVNDFSIKNDSLSINGCKPVAIKQFKLIDNVVTCLVYMQKSEAKYIMVSVPKANVEGFYARVIIEFYPQAKSISVWRGKKLIENFDNDLNN